MNRGTRRILLTTLLAVVLILLYVRQGHVQAVIDGPVSQQVYSSVMAARGGGQLSGNVAVVVMQKHEDDIINFRKNNIFPFLDRLIALVEACNENMLKMRELESRMSRFEERNAEYDNLQLEYMELERNIKSRLPAALVFDIMFGYEESTHKELVERLAKLGAFRHDTPFAAIAIENEYNYPEDMAERITEIYSSFTELGFGLAYEFSGGLVNGLLLQRRRGVGRPGAENITTLAVRFYRILGNPDIPLSDLDEGGRDVYPVYFHKDLTPTVEELFNRNTTGQQVFAGHGPESYSTDNLSDVRLRNLVGGRIVFVGGYSRTEDVQNTVLGDVSGVFVHANAVNTHFSGVRPLYLAFGWGWHIPVTLFLLVAAFFVRRSVDRKFRRKIKLDDMRIILTFLFTVLFFIFAYVIMIMIFDVQFYDISIPVFSLVFFCYLMRAKTRAEFKEILIRLRLSGGTLTRRIMEVNEQRQKKSGKPLFFTDGPFFDYVKKSAGSISNKSEYESFLNNLYKWFYDGSDALNRMPEGYKMLGLKIKWLRVFEFHHMSAVNKKELIEEKEAFLREILKSYTGREFLEDTDIRAFRRIQQSVLYEVEGFLHDLTKFYSLSDKKRESQGMPPIDERIKENLEKVLPGRSGEVLSILQKTSASKDRSEIAKQLEAANFNKSEINRVYGALFQRIGAK